MQTTMNAPVAAERRASERFNMYVRFDFRCRSADGTLLGGSGVTINVSASGALLLMPAAGIEVGASLELLLNWDGRIHDERGGLQAKLALRRGAGEPGPGCTPPGGERLVKVRAVVVRIQPLDGFDPTDSSRRGISVGFVRPSA